MKTIQKSIIPVKLHNGLGFSPLPALGIFAAYLILMFVLWV